MAPAQPAAKGRGAGLRFVRSNKAARFVRLPLFTATIRIVWVPEALHDLRAMILPRRIEDRLRLYVPSSVPST